MSFSKDVGSFAIGFSKGAEESVRGTTIKLWEAIIKGSPVDEGRFRGNWLAGYDEIEKTSENTDTSGAKTITNATNSVLKQADYNRFTLTNNLPYSIKIEYGGYGEGPDTVGGFSKQAPQGVVRVNVKRFGLLLEKEAKKNLPK